MFYKAIMSEKYGEQISVGTGEFLEIGEEVIIRVGGNGPLKEIDPLEDGWDIETIIRRGFFYSVEYFEDGFCECEDCGDYAPRDEMHWVEGDTRCVCDSCIDDYVRCAECGEYVHRDDAHYTDNRWGDYVCNHCWDYYDYQWCYECGHADRYENGEWHNGEWYCEDCAGEMSAFIHEYGHKPTPNFHGNGGIYMGVELEVDNGDNNDCLDGYVSDDDIYCKEDGSLSNDGFEIVSHPRTLASHKSYQWDNIMKICLRNGYESHDAKTCGLHIHVGRDFFSDSELASAKLLLIFGKFWDSFILPFSRRTNSQLHWCCAPEESHLITKDDDSEGIHDKICRAANDRYRAINLTNYDTIEFRVFRGTLKYSTFMATLEFVNGICNYVENTDVATIVDATAEDVFLSKYFDEAESYKAYLKERGIFTDEVLDADDYEEVV